MYYLIKTEMTRKKRKENHVRNNFYISLFKNTIQKFYPGILFVSRSDVQKFHLMSCGPGRDEKSIAYDYLSVFMGGSLIH